MKEPEEARVAVHERLDRGGGQHGLGKSQSAGARDNSEMTIIGEEGGFLFSSLVINFYWLILFISVKKHAYLLHMPQIGLVLINLTSDNFNAE